jgi:isopentenyl-diphosphate delta-isomerase
MKNQNNQLIALVDADDKVIGYDEKMKVHEEGTLHRAFSVFVFNKKGELLLQQRAHEKYHSPGLWTNTCCSHLLPDMSMEECVHDRLQFEMGFDCPVNFRFSFTYHIPFDNGLIEHETDHVYFAIWEGQPRVNPDEVAGYKWIAITELKNDMATHPENYTYWFKYIMEHHEKELFS